MDGYFFGVVVDTFLWWLILVWLISLYMNLCSAWYKVSGYHFVRGKIHEGTPKHKALVSELMPFASVLGRAWWRMFLSELWASLGQSPDSIVFQRRRKIDNMLQKQRIKHLFNGGGNDNKPLSSAHPAVVLAGLLYPFPVLLNWVQFAMPRLTVAWFVVSIPILLIVEVVRIGQALSEW